MIRHDIYDGPPLGYTKPGYRKKYIGLHNTSNDATAREEASYSKWRPDKTSTHYIGDDVEVIQSLDTALGANHAGSTEGNRYAISWELVGTNGKSRAWWLANLRWDLIVPIMAEDCREYGIEPRLLTVAEMRTGQARGFVTHKLMGEAWGGTDHTDPGPSFPVDHLLALVRAQLTGEIMNTLVVLKDTKPVYLGNGVLRRHVKDPAELAAVRAAAKAGRLDLADGGKVITVATQTELDAYGRDVATLVPAPAPPATVVMSPADRAAIVADLAALLPTAEQIAVATLDEDHRRSAA